MFCRGLGVGRDTPYSRPRTSKRPTHGRPMTVRPFKGCTISAHDLRPTPCACCARGVQPRGGPCERDGRTGSHGVRRGGVDREKASGVVLVRPAVQAGTCEPWYRLRGRSPGAGRPCGPFRRCLRGWTLKALLLPILSGVRPYGSSRTIPDFWIRTSRRGNTQPSLWISVKGGSSRSTRPPPIYYDYSDGIVYSFFWSLGGKRSASADTISLTKYASCCIFCFGSSHLPQNGLNSWMGGPHLALQIKTGSDVRGLSPFHIVGDCMRSSPAGCLPDKKSRFGQPPL